MGWVLFVSKPLFVLITELLKTPSLPEPSLPFTWGRGETDLSVPSPSVISLLTFCIFSLFSTSPIPFFSLPEWRDLKASVLCWLGFGEAVFWLHFWSKIKDPVLTMSKFTLCSSVLVSISIELWIPSSLECLTLSCPELSKIACVGIVVLSIKSPFKSCKEITWFCDDKESSPVEVLHPSLGVDPRTGDGTCWAPTSSDPGVSAVEGFSTFTVLSRARCVWATWWGLMGDSVWAGVFSAEVVGDEGVGVWGLGPEICCLCLSSIECCFTRRSSRLSSLEGLTFFLKGIRVTKPKLTSTTSWLKGCAGSSVDSSFTKVSSFDKMDPRKKMNFNLHQNKSEKLSYSFYLF